MTLSLRINKMKMGTVLRSYNTQCYRGSPAVLLYAAQWGLGHARTAHFCGVGLVSRLHALYTPSSLLWTLNAQVSSCRNRKQDHRPYKMLSSDDEGLVLGHTFPKAGLQLCGGSWIVVGRLARHTAAGNRE